MTDPEQVGQWAPFVTGRSLAVPGDVVLTMVDGDTEVQSPASVRRAERPVLLEYTWGGDLLRWELAPIDGGGTRLTLLHTIEDRGWIPKVAAGWHLCLDVAELLLDGTPVPPIRGEAAKEFGWEELRDAYATKLGEPPH